MARAPDYDLVVLGGGTAGVVASTVAAGAGARVALIERDRTGGDCLYTGCVPSKALLASASLAQSMREADRLGLEASEPKIDLRAVMDRVAAVIEAASGPDSPDRLRAAGVEVIEQAGRFLDPATIEAGGRRLRFRCALIATGSTPATPAIPGLDQVDALTNESLWELRELPARLAVLGGGPVGAELGQALSRLGSETTIVEAGERLLSAEEPEASARVAGRFEREGIRLRLGREAVAVEPAADGAGRLELNDGEGIEFDRLLVAVGRRPVTVDLGLDAAGVRIGGDGAVVVDELMRTSAPHIYAGGDVVGGLQFTHVAAYQALIAIANGLFRARRRAGRDWMPWVTFTEPEVASVGLRESQARERLGADPLVLRHDHSELDRALTASASGFSKLVADRRGRLLGATIVGPRAGESLSEVALLVRERGRVSALSQMVHAYPTFAESPVRAADQWWQLKYLTARNRRLLKPLHWLARQLDRPR